MKKAYKIYFILIFIFSVSSGILKANEKADSTHNAEQKGFDPGKLILDHIYDAYEWHIVTIANNHISIPLPIIVYSSQSGFHAFMSGKFHHGKSEYEGLKIAKEGRYAGKIVEMSSAGEEIRPYDFSITKNVFTLFFSVIMLIVIFLKIAKRYSDNFARAPKGIQSWLEPIIIFVRDDIAKSNIGEKKYEKYLPYLLTTFFFILFNNLLGIIPIFPGGANFTGNIAVTLILALFTFVITIFSGSKSYYLHIINTPGAPWWLKLPVPLMPIVEIIGFFVKPFALMIRLFANITAGHVVALGFWCLIFIFGEKNIFVGYSVSVVSLLFVLFMSLLELLVIFIQAYVFTLLSALYIGMAIESHETVENSEH